MKKTFSIFGLLLIPGLTLAIFPDVTGNHTNYEAVKYVEAEGVVNGYGDGTFKPDNLINRAELAKILVAANFNQELIDTCDLKAQSFSDVPTDTWFSPYVCIAKEAGIIGGYGDGTFKPAQNVNFVEAAKMISLSFGQNDGAIGDTWYTPFVDTLSNRNAIPTTITHFEKNISRGEMAEMVYRIKAKAMKKSSLVFANNQLSAKSDSANTARDPNIAVQQEYDAAVSKNTLAAYEMFITRHADNPLAIEAKTKIELLGAVENSLPPANPGQYLDLNSKDWESALGSKMIALFFHAEWCPSCRSVDSDIQAKLPELPENSIVFKVDYDTETELRKQFGVTQQHTVVFIDETKNAFLRKAGFSFQDLIENL